MASLKNTNKILKKSSLFWDVKLKIAELKKYKEFIIGRILEFGDMEDYLWAVKVYGKKTVMGCVSNNSKLDKKSANFWCLIFNLDKTQCIRNQSTKKQSWFWKK